MEVKLMFDTVRKKWSYLLHVRMRNLPIFYKVVAGRRTAESPRIVGMIRLRNEASLLQDTLDHLATIVDGIVVFDDASTDSSVAIAAEHPHVLEIVVNRRWQHRNRVWEETANRRKLYSHALRFRPEWVFYSDADERFEGDIRRFLLTDCPADVHGLRINLFDAYMTNGDSEPHQQGQSLWGFRRYFGIERRRILMAWRPSPTVDFTTPDAREPQGITGTLVDKFFCQHYGKALSLDQWEETCRYYVDNFPIYRDKWLARLGKGIHTTSDFGTELFPWPEVTRHAVDI